MLPARQWSFSPGWICRISILVLIIALPAMAALDTVSNFFSKTMYDEARQSLEEGTEGLRAGEATLWQVRLAKDPADALVMLRESLNDDGLLAEVRMRMVLETANIEFGLGNYQSSLKALSPLISGEESNLPGNIYLRAGLCLRALGNLQKAREMLASVKPGDQAFVMARYYLGDIALQQNDAELALRYFESSLSEGGPGQVGRIAGGKWRAFRTEGRDQEASDLEQVLARSHPGSLGHLEIQRLMREQEEELAVNSMDNDVPTGNSSSQNQDNRGRYALQLGAYSDRGLALEFIRRHQGQLPDLRIDEVRDDRGQFLYKVRSGSFVNPVLARTEARRLADRLDLDVIVADLSDAGQMD